MPNSFRQALAAQHQDGPHPDPDLLGGFAEGTLGQRERECVIAHLATCVRCREVVHLSTAAAPAEVTANVIATAPSRRNLGLRFAWLASAAAIAIIATTVVIHESARQNAPGTASNATPPQQTAEVSRNQAAESQSTSEQPEAVSPALPPAPTAGSRQSRAKSTATPPPHALRESGAKTESSPVQESREIIAAQATQREQSVQTNTNANTFAGKNVISTDKVGGVTAGGVGGTGNGSGAGAGLARSSAYTAKAVPPQSRDQQVTTVAPAAAFESTPPLKKAEALTTAVQQHWRIDNSGHLQRSALQGGWETLLDSEHVRFRVVFISGNDVWAGGERLRLYHSTDSGSTWTLITLPAKDSQDQSITHIHFDNPQIGRVDSNTGTVWITNDGGLTWK